MLASEPVGGRSRATELPCFHLELFFNVILFLSECFPLHIAGFFFVSVIV